MRNAALAWDGIGNGEEVARQAGNLKVTMSSYKPWLRGGNWRCGAEEGTASRRDGETAAIGFPMEVCAQQSVR